MEHLSSKVIYPQGCFPESKQFQFIVNNEKLPSICNVLTVHCNDCPESGMIVVGGEIVSKFKHIETKDYSVHTFEMWESPKFLPIVLLSNNVVQLLIKFSEESKQSFFDSKGLFNPKSMFIKVYYEDDHDFLLKFVPNGKLPIDVDLKNGTFDIVSDKPNFSN